MIRVLVTGSSGRVGSAVCAALKEAGSQVRGTDRVPGRHTTMVADLAQLEPAHLDGVDAVVHTAALHAPHVGERPDGEFWRVNVEATEQLLALAGSRRVVYTSSTSVYGDALVPDGEAVWVTESLQPRPRDVYDETKLSAESLVAQSPNSIVLRMARCFPEPPETLAIYRMHRGVAMADVVAAHLAAVEATATGVVNVAGPYRFQRRDMPRLWHDAPAVIAERYPSVPGAFVRRGWTLPERIDRVYVSAAATAAIGWRPVHDVSECLT
jgi:nucleoside-diphosphate-sugar epimerase